MACLVCKQAKQASNRVCRIEKNRLLAHQARSFAFAQKRGTTACLPCSGWQARTACLLSKQGLLACSASKDCLLAQQARTACLLSKQGLLVCSARVKSNRFVK